MSKIIEKNAFIHHTAQWRLHLVLSWVAYDSIEKSTFGKPLGSKDEIFCKIQSIDHWRDWLYANRFRFSQLIFQLIAKRYEKHCTLITTNIPFSKWGEIFGSPTLANAVLDRLLHHSQVISIKRPSYRLKEKRAFMETQTEE